MTIIAEKVIATAINYLGPAANKFLQRQTNFHMNGLNFETIDKQHLVELAKWVNVSASLLIGEQKGKELADRIAGI
jgi:hypothetical protein